MFSIINNRKCYRDYWSNDPLLHSNIISETMSRNTFERIKHKFKMNKKEDKNDSDKVWRIRKIINMFRKNIQQFDFFCSALSIDEMMVKYFGRTILKQFIRNKPVRFGIKLWALCTIHGFLLDFDVYCGKDESINEKCALGSRVVLKMLREFFQKKSFDEISKYHVTFDNYFCSPDLLVRLKKLGLRATGTVRDERVFTKEMFKELASSNQDNDQKSTKSLISRKVKTVKRLTKKQPVKKNKRKKADTNNENEEK